MLLSIPPKYTASQVVGYIKGKSAIHIGRTYLGQKKNYPGMHFGARGYFVSTVGADEEVVRAYIQDQEKEDHRIEQLSLFKKATTEWWSFTQNLNSTGFSGRGDS
jgi:putative transposase